MKYLLHFENVLVFFWHTGALAQKEYTTTCLYLEGSPRGSSSPNHSTGLLQITRTEVSDGGNRARYGRPQHILTMDEDLTTTWALNPGLTVFSYKNSCLRCILPLTSFLQLKINMFLRLCLTQRWVNSFLWKGRTPSVSILDFWKNPRKSQVKLITYMLIVS